MKNRLGFLTIALTSLLLQGCGSIAKGVAEAVLNNDAQTDTRLCDVRGPAYPGIAEALRRQAQNGRPVKVLMVHGMGANAPGYSGRFVNRLVRLLELDVVDEHVKELRLPTPPSVRPARYANLRVSRYRDREQNRELLFYELHWAKLSDHQKALVAYDDGWDYSHNKASLNQLMKFLLSSHIPDPLFYLGDSQKRIQDAATQSLCWLFSGGWQALDEERAQRCDLTRHTRPAQVARDEFFIVTQSLGGRIALEALERISSFGWRQPANSAAHRLSAALQGKTITINMLASQLPLMRAVIPPPAASDQLTRYCRADGERYAQRWLEQTRLVAFSDPNDIMSYVLSPKFAAEQIDSRLCPKAINVSINIAAINKLPILGTYANPLTAHNEYDNDERVIELIAGGIGTGAMTDLIARRCHWTETRE